MAQAPPLTQSDAVTSLLSLSIAAASTGASPSPRQHPTLLSSPSAKHHRRLASTGKTRRRLSDAREACSQPSHASNTAALSLASLSLSASPSSTKHSSSGICKPLAPKPHSHSNSIHVISGSAPNPGHVPLARDNNFSLLASAATAASRPGAANAEKHVTSTNPIPISGKAGTKKRGIDYKCESCSKVYRHPNCLNKHRWEHTRQWREASKFVLSKHQQVQLLEAAAILSFMGKQPASLPEDRSEWPSFLSGGSLPKVEPAVTVSVHSSSTSASPPSESSLASDLSSATSNLSHFPTTTTATTTATTAHPISSSVPNPQPSGPRLHDYALKSPGGKVVVTQVRPGLLLGVNNDPASSSPYPQPATHTRVPQHHHAGYSYDYGYTPPVVPAPGGGPNGDGVVGTNNSMWSLPNSSMRSHGRSLSSFSGSVSVQSEDGDIEIEDDDDDDDDEGRGGRRMFGRNGRHGMGMGIDVEGDADGMDHDEIYDEHNDNDEEDEDEEEEEGTQTQSEVYTRYTSRYHAPPRMDDMDIEMDMDMD